MRFRAKSEPDPTRLRLRPTGLSRFAALSCAAFVLSSALSSMADEATTPQFRAEPISSPKPNADSGTSAGGGAAAAPQTIKAQLHIEPATAPAIAPATAPSPSSAESKEAERFFNEVKLNCDRHFPGQLQSEVRTACASASRDFVRLGKLGKTLAQTRCRLNYGEEPRLAMSCLIGAKIADSINTQQDGFKKNLQLCSENYPVHNVIDEVLLESCLTGIYMPSLMKLSGKERFDACAEITPERSFIGPCAVGLSLAQDPDLKVAPASQNKLCDQYFNLNQFHKGYRACLNSRSLAPQVPSKFSDAIKGCANVVSEANNDTERAACMVGLSIYRHLANQDDVGKRFQKCGDSKVTYQDRDILACLTAASLLDFTDKTGAESGCKEVFKELKSHSRSDCLKFINLF